MADESINGALKAVQEELKGLSKKVGETHDTVVRIVERFSAHSEREDIHTQPPCQSLQETRGYLKWFFLWLLSTTVAVAAWALKEVIAHG